jgi:hypothetical protein
VRISEVLAGCEPMSDDDWARMVLREDRRMKRVERTRHSFDSGSREGNGHPSLHPREAETGIRRCLRRPGVSHRRRGNGGRTSLRVED